MTYLIKRLGSQEMGSRDKHSKNKRGKYFYISKKEEILSFFPPLRTTQKNDFIILPIVPIDRDESIKVYCTYVYHNDKYHGSTAKSPRNEFRLYLNDSLDPERATYNSEDIVIFRKEKVQLEEDELSEQTIYFLYHIKFNSELYKEVNSYLNNENYTLFNGEIDFFDNKIQRILNNSDREFIALIDDSVKKDVRKRSEGIQNLFNASTFRDFVLEGYNRVCAVTGISIKFDNFLNIEAAHIQPKSHAGTFEPKNGIALSRDIHWAFDKGFFTLDDNFIIKVHPEVDSHFLKSYNNKKIRLPEEDFFKPDKANLEYHRNNIYGLFKLTGRL